MRSPRTAGHKDSPAISIDWGVWSDVGIAAARSVDTKVSGQGIGAITPEEGLLLVKHFLKDTPVQILVSRFDWSSFLRQYAGGSQPRLLENFRRETGSILATTRDASSRVERSNGSSFIDQLTQAAPAQRRNLLNAFVTQQVMRVLGLEDDQSILERKPLNEMGLNSLMAIELRNLLSDGLKLKKALPATLVFNYPTIVAICDYLSTELVGLNENERNSDHSTDQSTLVKAAETVEKQSGDGALNDMITDLEELSDEEIDRLLAQKFKGDEA